MTFLFPPLPPQIPGLTYLENVISDAEEQTLISDIDSKGEWSATMRRRVQHYGFRYDYRSRRIDTSMRASPLPEWLLALAARFKDLGIMAQMPDQTIINEYLPGQGISKHIDCEPCFGPEIASLSLGSDCVMVFTHASTNEAMPLLLKRRAFLRLTGAARYEWMHAIPGRRTDVFQGEEIIRSRRLSITFRSVILS